MRARVLLVEDSEEYQRVVARALSGHDVVFAGSVGQALGKLAQNSYDLILLDLGLPDQPGFNFLTEMQSRADWSSIPVLCLTGKTELTDKVTAFSLGADDYILKPFDPLELRARVESRIAKRKQHGQASQIISAAGIEINQSSHRVVVVDGEVRKSISLTQTEFKLLSCLIRRPDQVFSREQLLDEVWGHGADVSDRAVDVHLSGLRGKLGKKGKHIRAVPGVGYLFDLTKETKKSA